MGVDAGGTWVRALALRDGRPGRRRRAPAVAGAEPEVLRGIWARAGWERVGALVVAARGVWTPAERRALAARLAGLALRVRVIADVEAAHRGALGGGPGVLVLAGTGSIVLGRGARGAWVREGGLGPLLGDDGSGFWIGREWLRAAGDPARARALARGEQPAARIAALAKGVLARARGGAPLERRIVGAAQASLAAQAAAVAGRLGLAGPVPVSWAGSLLEQAWFRRGVARALARQGVRARWVGPQEDPALAAARLAGGIR